MKNLQIFNNPDFGQVRCVEVNGKPYVVGRDIAEMLEYAEPHKAISAHCKGGISYPILTNGGMQETKIIPEGDIYRLIVKAADQSKNPEIKVKAEKIEKWIFDEVLPSIRKHGMYAKDELLDNPDLLIDVITKLKQEREEKKLLADKLEQQKPLVMFAETCIASNDSILVRELAKLASKNGVIIGEKRLYKRLREWGLILGRKNEPSQKAMDAGWFEVKKGTYSTPYGSEAYATSLVTPKGQIYIIERLRKEQREAI